MNHGKQPSQCTTSVPLTLMAMRSPLKNTGECKNRILAKQIFTIERDSIVRTNVVEAMFVSL